MADTPPVAPEAAEKPPAAPAPNPMLILIAVAVAGLALGGTLGGAVIAPRLIAARHPSPAESPGAAADDDDVDASHDKKGKHDDDKKNSVYRIDNVIVNPAGSQGARFLMASVAFEVRNPQIQARLQERDIQVRDAVTATLESQTMEMLSRPGARDSLRHQLANAVRPFVGGAKLNVYLPQFVVQ